MTREDFERLVAEAVEALPPEFKDKLENIAVVVADWPSPYQLSKVGVKNRENLLGLYEGVPRLSRGTGYNLVPPDKITIFRRPLELRCRSSEELVREIRRVVHHEIAHHFGIDDRRLGEIEGGVKWKR